MDVLENHGIPLEVQSAAEMLLRVANRHKVIVAGYMFAAVPSFVVNFGNCVDAGDARLFQLLCEMHEKSVAAGAIVHIPVTEIQ